MALVEIQKEFSSDFCSKACILNILFGCISSIVSWLAKMDSLTAQMYSLLAQLATVFVQDPLQLPVDKITDRGPIELTNNTVMQDEPCTSRTSSLVKLYVKSRICDIEDTFIESGFRKRWEHNNEFKIDIIYANKMSCRFIGCYKVECHVIVIHCAIYYCRRIKLG